MSAVPGSLDIDEQPPMTVPLRHFVVGLAFLVAGCLVGLASAAGLAPGNAGLAHVHLLLVGWVCLTIMGAMTQFVPVWSGVTLHSQRLATVQLWLVVAGLVGFASALLTEWLVLAPVFGAVMALGVWVFVYNVGRTLAGADGFDETERHFAIALAFFVLLTILGVVLAVDFVHPLFASVPVTHADVVGAHATLAVYGAILTTVLGALYQLGTMFTQTDLHGVDHHLRRLEEVAFPLGVLGLATARLLGASLLGRVAGAMVLAGLFAMSVILARRLYETQVPWTPMLSRYAVVAVAMAAWALLALPAWLDRPLAGATRFGAPGTVHLLTVGIVGFVVLGTLYHVVPFIVWVHRYSDRLGLESVPMIDDLYSDRLAAIDLACFLAGTGLLVVGDVASKPRSAMAAGGLLVVAGALAVSWNLLAVLRNHSPDGALAVVFPSLEHSRSAEERTTAE